MVWYPHVTVATIVQRNDQYLMVQEEAFHQDKAQLVLNQPAGHLDEHETLLQAAVRETREETAWEVRLTHCTGIYHYRSPDNDVTYVRVSFAAEPVKELDEPLDPDIHAACWMSLEEIMRHPHRSPMVRQSLLDAADGLNIPLVAIRHFDPI